MVFDSEAAFEDAVVEALCSYGWGDVGDVIVRPTEQELIDNWAAILFDRNKHRDRLNGVPAANSIETYLDEHYDNDRMYKVYPKAVHTG